MELGSLFVEVPAVSQGGIKCTSSTGSEWQQFLQTRQIQVRSAEARPLNVPLKAPFTIATTRLQTVNNVAIHVQLEDGSRGWGESPTLFPVTAEDQAMALSKTSHCCKALLGDQHHSITAKSLLDKIGEILPGHESASARAGVEMAVIDAVARSVNLPLWKFFGGFSQTLTTDITIPICEPATAAVLAEEYAGRGFDTIKTKVGGRSLSLDIAMLHAIRSKHPGCSLILDANEGYSAEEALHVLKELHEAGITPVLFEQPVAREDWEGLARVTREAGELYGVPVAADESCRSVEDAKRIVDEKLASVINIKLAKLGVLGALEVISLARQNKVELMIGGMVETRLAMGFGAHLAAGLGCFRYVDLDTPLLLSEDPVQGGYQVHGPVYTFTDVPGQGTHLKWS